MLDLWSFFVLLFSSFVVGWAAETAQVFIPRALALSVLAWLQTLPEFAIEATIAWDQNRGLMIANLTGSLRLLVGLGWPVIFLVHFVAEALRKKGFVKEVILQKEDSISVLFLFIPMIYFFVIVVKGSLSLIDSAILGAIYVVYLFCSSRFTVTAPSETNDDLPWISRKIVAKSRLVRVLGIAGLFFIGGLGIYLSVHPFLNTLQRWAVAIGISSFVFVQWVAPFLSEFPEYLTAVNWARRPNKASLAVLNFISSNINQWTILSAMIPIVFSLSLGHPEAIRIEGMPARELMLTLAQGLLGGILLLDLRYSWLEAIGLFFLWSVQFLDSSLRGLVTLGYVTWILFELGKLSFLYLRRGQLPAMALAIFGRR